MKRFWCAVGATVLVGILPLLLLAAVIVYCAQCFISVWTEFYDQLLD